MAPRHSTLERIARAMGVDPQIFYSESKIQEVERKWAASMGPRQALVTMAGRVVSVPLLDTSTGYPRQINDTGEPQGRLEMMLQIPTISGEPAGTRHFALRVTDESMRGRQRDDFRPGEIVVFGTFPEVRSGDYAFLVFDEVGSFRQVETLDSSRFNLMPLNADFPQQILARHSILGMWRMVRHMRIY